MQHAPLGMAWTGIFSSLFLTSCECGATPEPPPPSEPTGAAGASGIDRPSRPAPRDARPPADAAGTPSFNQVVLRLIEGYEAGGGYAWPAPRGTHGTTRDLYLEGTALALAADRGTHCSGLTFEIFWRALESWPGGPTRAGLTPQRARQLMRQWFVPRARGMGPAEALPAFALGRRIEALEQARPGDFIQVWMNSGRGHTAIFLGWVRDRNGRIVASRHWSTHPDTDGIGIEVRAIGAGPRDIDREAIYIGRAMPGAP